MDDQTELGPELEQRNIVPSNDIEPAVWFEHVWILKTLEGGLTDDNLVRSFKCRPGLNILWSKPEKFDADTGLYGDGVSGHSTGKTLFCRILRGILGEDDFGPEGTKERLADEFDSIWAVAKIRLNQTTWIVGRNLTEGLGAAFAEMSDDVDTVLALKKRSDFASFLSGLNLTQSAGIQALVPDSPWLHLLPCLTRDQEARFSSIVRWRDASAGSAGFQMNSQTRHALLRLVIGALDPEEFTLRENVADAERELKADVEQLVRTQTQAASTLVAAKSQLATIKDYSLDITDLKAARDKLESAIAVREEALKNQAELGRTPETETAEIRLADASSEHTKAENRLEVLKSLIPGKAEALRNTQQAIERSLTWKHKDPKRAEEDYCPNTKICALKNNCLEDPASVDPQSLKELKDLEAEETGSKNELKLLENERTALAERLPKLLSAKNKAAADLKAQQLADLGNLAKQKVLVPQLKGLMAHLTTAIDESEKLAVALKTRDELEASISKSKERIRLLREEKQSSLHYLSDILSDIVKALMGTKVRGTLKVTETGLEVGVKRGSKETPLSGAALESIKTLAFDLAMLVQGIEGKSKHPRFLIHDGPREADMARVVYERFFLYIEKLEDSFGQRSPNFQYFITTTTPPPQRMITDDTNFLICPPLSGESDSTKLLGKSF